MSKKKTIICLDLEGVLIPEIWVAVAHRTDIPEFKRTTRDEPNYNKLMRYRINLMKKHKIKLEDIQKVIATMQPLSGAKTLLKKIRAEHEVVILSDTFYGFAQPLMSQLDYPTLFCNDLVVEKNGYIRRHVMRQEDGKRKAVKAFRALNFNVIAAGDSFNDLTMLQSAHQGILFRPPAAIKNKYKHFPIVDNHKDLASQIAKNS